MGKFFKSLWAIIKRILKAIIDFIKKYWWIILIIVAIWFAPSISAFLASSGAPAWLSGAFTWIGANLTPTLMTVGSYLWSGAQTVGSGVADIWSGLSVGTKAALVVGASALIAPEETAAALEALSEGLGDVLGAGVGALVSSPLGIVVLGALAFWLFAGKGSERNPPTNKDIRYDNTSG